MIYKNTQEHDYRWISDSLNKRLTRSVYPIYIVPAFREIHEYKIRFCHPYIETNLNSICKGVMMDNDDDDDDDDDDNDDDFSRISGIHATFVKQSVL